MIGFYTVGQHEVNYTQGIENTSNISFNGYSLVGSTLIPEETTWGNVGARYEEADAPRSDGEIFLSRFWEGKSFTFVVTIMGEGATNEARKISVQNKLDEFCKMVLNVPNGYLKRKMPDGTFRKKRCSATSIPIPDFQGNCEIYKQLQVTFESIDAFWIGEVNQSELFEGVTTDPFNFSYEPEGSAPSLPILYFFMGSSGNTGITGIQVETNYGKLTYTGSIANGDIIEINSQDEQKMFKNGTQVYPDGGYPELFQEQNQFTITMTGASSVNYDLTVTNKIKYHF